MAAECLAAAQGVQAVGLNLCFCLDLAEPPGSKRNSGELTASCWLCHSSENVMDQGYINCSLLYNQWEVVRTYS